MDITAGRAALRKLTSAAMLPLEWEISLLRRYDGHIKRLNALKANGILPEVRMLPGAERTAYIRLIAEAVEVGTADIIEMLQNLESNLYSELGEKFSDLAKASTNPLADHVFNWFENNGGKFFKTAAGEALLFFEGEIYHVDNNDEFEAMIYRLTRLNFKEKPGNFLYQVLKLKCLNKGERVQEMTWTFTDLAKDTIFLNLSDPQNRILKLAPGREPEAIDNGTNDDKVLLKRSFQIKPFTYLPDAEERRAMELFKKIVIDYVATETPQRYFVGAWLLTSFLMGLQDARGLVHLVGGSGSGKSRAAERFSYLVMGDNCVGQGTGAGNVRVAANSPITFLDNIESSDWTKERIQFVLALASGLGRTKASSMDDTSVVHQKLNSMGVITSIEPLPAKAEILNRVFVVELDESYAGRYHHEEMKRLLLHERDYILSGIFKMISRKVLPNLSRRIFWSDKLVMDHPKHNKERMNEHLTTIMLVLEGMLEHIPYIPALQPDQQAGKLLNMWLDYQEAHARTTAVTANSLLRMLDGLAKVVMSKMRAAGKIEYNDFHREFGEKPVKEYHDPDLHHTFFLTDPETSDEEGVDDDGKLLGDIFAQCQYFEIIATAKELADIFSGYCKGLGIRSPFATSHGTDATAVGARLSDDNRVMKSGGWAYVTKVHERDGSKAPLWYRRVNGQTQWRLRKRIRVYGNNEK